MQLFQNKEAEILLADKIFIFGWKELLKKCPWATIFQSPEFVSTWYNFFPEYKKIILCEMEKEKPIGLFFLTVDLTGAIVGAGTNLAEYQSWICFKENKEFSIKSIELLTKVFPEQLISIKYIPEGPVIPESNTRIGKKHLLLSIPHARPIMENKVDWLEKELKKKNRKEKVNRLNRIGKLEFSKINNLIEFSEILSLLVYQNELRKGAMYGKTAFIDEPKKIDFMVALFKLGLLHVSVLKLNSDIIASNAGIQGDGKVYLQGLNTISPYYMKYSPGILHFLMLGIHLESEGIPIFDLTPGGSDGYKSMLSSETWTCTEILIGKRSKIKTVDLRQKVKAWLLKTRFSNKPLSDHFKKLYSIYIYICSIHWPKYSPYILSGFKNNLSKKQIVLDLNIGSISTILHNFTYKPNDLECLFLIGQKVIQTKRKGFYQDCLSRMEFGQSFFGIRLDNNCIGLLWTWRNEDFDTPENKIVFYQYSAVHKFNQSRMIELATLVHLKEQNGVKNAQILID